MNITLKVGISFCKSEVWSRTLTQPKASPNKNVNLKANQKQQQHDAMC